MKAADLKANNESSSRSQKGPSVKDNVDPGLAYYSLKPGEERRGKPKDAKAQKTRSYRTILKRSLMGLLALMLALIIIWGAWMSWEVSKNSQKLFGSGNLFSLLGTSGLKGEDRGRVNILLAGYSVDDPNHPGASLTDSIMLVSLNTIKHTGYILSIPRDLYVNIPGFGYAKINEAYQDGNRGGFSQDGYPPGGMGLLEKVVARDFNIPIDYYALINYTAFRDAVNAVGGISVNIKSPDERGLYDPNISPVDGGPLKLANGWQNLDGQTALNLARARGDSYYSYGFPRSDFDRTTHQRQMLTALKAKVLRPGFILFPNKVGKLLGALGDNVKTDFALGDMRRLYQITHSIKDGSLASVSLNDAAGKDLLSSYSSYDSGSALIPAAGLGDYWQIDQFITDLNSK